MITPCPGLSLYRTPNGHAFFRLHYLADPELTPEVVAKLRDGYTSEAFWKREMEIEAGALKGQKVYPDFNPEIHVVDDAEIPAFGCCYMAIDPHPRTPHAMLWILIDPWSDWYVYRELWPSKMYGVAGKIRDDEQENEYTTREYAEYIALLEGNQLVWRHAETDRESATYKHTARVPEKIVTRWMDQAGKAFKVSAEGAPVENYATRYDKFGIVCEDPIKSHQAGEDAVKLLLKVRNHELRGPWPRLHISNQCPELILELLNHRYKITRTPSEERDLKQDRSEFRCHLVDLLRYIGTSEARYAPKRVSRRFTKQDLQQKLRSR